MLDVQARFIAFYNNVLRSTEMFKKMNDTFEGSPWHREKSVRVHTDMVVNNYILISKETNPHMWLVGALACAFHDVGKPKAEEHLFSEERGNYRRYAGHEMISSRIWENWAVTNWPTLSALFPELTQRAIIQVGWIIQHHLPFSLKDKTKVSRLIATASNLVTRQTFVDCLLADCRGRISDDHDVKLANTTEWTEVFLNADDSWHPHDSDKVCHVLIGASGSGKSTFVSTLRDDQIEQGRGELIVHSMDALRHELYGDDYATAFRMSTEDKQFKSKVQQHFMDAIKRGVDVVVDNTNTSVKSRGFYVLEAAKKGYQIRAVMFPVALETVIARQSTRPDKTVPNEAVIRQYDNLQLPFYGEFDYILMMPIDNK